MSAEPLELGLAAIANGLGLLLEGLSVATVLVGLIASLRGSRGRGGIPFRSARGGITAMRLSFGSWLCLALEFQLGADIVATTSSPSADHLIQLAVVAVIRTVLNVFLARELASERTGAES